LLLLLCVVVVRCIVVGCVGCCWIVLVVGWIIGLVVGWLLLYVGCWLVVVVVVVVDCC